MRKVYADIPVKEEKKDVKVALIDKPDLTSLPTPGTDIPIDDYSVLDNFAYISSTE